MAFPKEEILSSSNQVILGHLLKDYLPLRGFVTRRGGGLRSPYLVSFVDDVLFITRRIQRGRSISQFLVKVREIPSGGNTMLCQARQAQFSRLES